MSEKEKTAFVSQLSVEFRFLSGLNAVLEF